MILSLSLIFLVGLSLGGIFRLLHLPHVIGMLFSGIVLGPFVLDLLDPTILNISSELRQIALIIILIKAGLALTLSDLKQVGRCAIAMSFIPASLEILAYYIFAPRLFDVSGIDALVMGTVLSAVSPAIVVPRMIDQIKKGSGTDKKIPHLILAAASCDDIFVIVLFSSFLGMANGLTPNAPIYFSVPTSIISGIIIGSLLGVILTKLLKRNFSFLKPVKIETVTLIILSVSFFLIAAQEILPLPFSGLLAIVSMACIIKIKSDDPLSKKLSGSFAKLWVAAEAVLFVLVGAAVDIGYLLRAGVMALVMIFIGLVFRSLGVALSLVRSKLNLKERVFCIIAYLPKATVQAAIGAVPLSMGIEGGELILSVAVLAIVVTAPLGAIGIDRGHKCLLHQDRITE